MANDRFPNAALTVKRTKGGNEPSLQVRVLWGHLAKAVVHSVF
jgi:hypothetical protein